MLVPDIQTSLHSGWAPGALAAYDMQSLLLWIFQLPPTDEVPDSALIITPSGRRYIDQCGPSVMSFPTILARICFSSSNLNCSSASPGKPATSSAIMPKAQATRIRASVMIGPLFLLRGV